MPAQIVSILGYVFFALAAGAAIYYWRRATGLYALLVEGASRFEELRQRGGQLELALQKSEEKLKQQKEQAGRLDKGLADAREKSAVLLKKLEIKEHEVTLVTDKLEAQKRHLEHQLLRTEEHLKIAEEQRDGMITKAAALANDGEQRLLALKQESDLRERDLSLRERDANTKIRELEKHCEIIERKLKSIDPEEIRRYKRKLAQYDRLYSSMRGLREMSEERNRNWEVALQKLAFFVLKETQPDGFRPPEDIGPMVGLALQSIGAQLIDDADARSESIAEAETVGAMLASNMDGE